MTARETKIVDVNKMASIRRLAPLLASRPRLTWSLWEESVLDHQTLFEYPGVGG